MTEHYKLPTSNSESIPKAGQGQLSYEYLFEGPIEEVEPNKITEVVPGVVYKGDMHKHTIDMRQSRLWHMEEDDKKISEYGSEVSRWLQENELQTANNLRDIPAPKTGEEMLSGIKSQTLDLFKSRAERPVRKLEAIEYTTGKLIDALVPGKQGEESFIKKILPPDVHIGKALIVFDKDQRYRDIVAAACYKIMDQLADEGLLDSYERVKNNRDYKTVNHSDSAIARGRNRDVVVGMTLDMLSGRFNADENRRASAALGDNDRDGRGVFRGGHHSGAAYQVMHILNDPLRYDHYFGSSVITPEEKFKEVLSSQNFVEKVNSVKPEYDTLEVRSYSQLPGKVEAHTQAFEFAAQNYSEVVVDPDSTGRPVSLTRTMESDTDGTMVRGLLVRDIARYVAVKNIILTQAIELGVKLDSDELLGLVSQYSRMAGIEKFVPEDTDATIGRDKNATMPLPESSQFVSRNHAVFSVDKNGKIVVKDISTNGSIISYR